MNWFERLRGKPSPPGIDEAAWRGAVAASPLARRLSARDRQLLRELAERFMRRKRFHAVDMELDARQQLSIAVQACMPLLRPGHAALRGWQSVIVYPGLYRAREHHHEADTGVVTEIDEIRAGEAWQRGPLVLSWASVEQSLSDPWCGINVVVHEMAHKLDMLDGSVDGLPPLPRDMSRRAWIEAFQRAYDGLSDALDRGKPTGIDSYAATNPGEYFAVVSELHFSDPARLQRVEPAIAGLLRDYYGPSPAPQMPAEASAGPE